MQNGSQAGFSLLGILDLGCCAKRPSVGRNTVDWPTMKTEAMPDDAQPPSRVSRMLKDNVKGVLVNKAKREMKLGVRLAERRDGSQEGVEVIDVHPDGPLANVIQTGDIVLRINGQLCNTGFDAAAEMLRDAFGMVECVAPPLART